MKHWKFNQAEPRDFNTHGPGPVLHVEPGEVVESEDPPDPAFFDKSSKAEFDAWAKRHTSDEATETEEQPNG